MEKVIELINKNIAEHQAELEIAGDYKTKLKSKIITGQAQLRQKSPKVAETAMQILSLNEKVNFHMAAIKVLEGLKKELDNG